MHVYASLDDAKRYAIDEGIAWGAGSTNDALALSILESVSRHVDAWCRRRQSGFGPRVGTNRYDAHGRDTLYFNDDLLATDEVTVLASTGSADTTTPAEGTDFYLINNDARYEPGPFRAAVLHGQGTQRCWPRGSRVIEWAGTWGYSDVTYPLTPTLSGALDDDDTVVEVDLLGELSPGQTILVDDEQMYVRAITDADPTFTMTVVRGVNGTTAASHLDDAPIARYVYEPTVVEATLRVWAKRWNARNAGGDGSDGGGQVGTVYPRESEDTILRRTCNHLRLMGAVVFGPEPVHHRRRLW